MISVKYNISKGSKGHWRVQLQFNVSVFMLTNHTMGRKSLPDGFKIECYTETFIIYNVFDEVAIVT